MKQKHVFCVKRVIAKNQMKSAAILDSTEVTNNLLKKTVKIISQNLSSAAGNMTLAARDISVSS